MSATIGPVEPAILIKQAGCLDLPRASINICALALNLGHRRNVLGAIVEASGVFAVELTAHSLTELGLHEELVLRGDGSERVSQCALDWTRTSGLPLRRRSLYPPELRGLGVVRLPAAVRG